MYKNGKPNYNEIIFSQDELDDIKNLYQNKISSVKIGKKYHVNHHVILKALHQMGVEVSQRKMVRKYGLDENYFDYIDTPEKAYILGLLYADGSNCIDKSTISISLQESDKDLLEQIRQLLHSEKSLEYLNYSDKDDFGYHYKNQYRLLVFSKHMCEKLSSWGIVPNKSLITTFPDFISDNLLPHFVRGVFDGDGSLCRHTINDNNHHVNVTITATECFCQGLKSHIEQLLDIHCGIYDASCHNGVTRVLGIGGRNVAKQFLDWIYADATIFLQRKYDRYLDYYTMNESLSA